MGNAARNQPSARIEYGLYDNSPEKKRDERSTMWERTSPRGQDPVTQSEFLMKRIQYQKALMDAASPSLNWKTKSGMCFSGCLTFSSKDDWKISLSKSEDGRRISLIIEPTLNMISCLFSLVLFYPLCLMCDADALEISVERVGDRVFFRSRRKFLCLERVSLDLHGVIEVRVTDQFSTDGEDGEGVQVEVLIEHEGGSSKFKLPHSYHSSFYPFFIEFHAMVRDLINGTESLGYA